MCRCHLSQVYDMKKDNISIRGERRIWALDNSSNVISPDNNQNIDVKTVVVDRNNFRNDKLADVKRKSNHRYR